MYDLARKADQRGFCIEQQAFQPTVIAPAFCPDAGLQPRMRLQYNVPADRRQKRSEAVRATRMDFRNDIHVFRSTRSGKRGGSR